MKFIRVLKANNDELIDIGWSLDISWEDENEEIHPYYDIPDDELGNIVDKIENWFLKEGYKQFFTSIIAEGHDAWGLGGSAFVTQDQYDECNFSEGWSTTSGTLHLPPELEAPKGYIWVTVVPFDPEEQITIEGR